MADEAVHQARESQTLDSVRDAQGQPTRVTSTLDDADVKFRDALEEALKPIDPQPNPTAKDRRKGSQYKEVGHVDLGCNYRRRHDGYRFTAEKLREFRTLRYGLEKRIEREKDVETVQEEVKREWKKMIDLRPWTNVNRLRESPEMKERFRQMLREERSPEIFFLHKVKFVTKTWAVRLTDEWLRKTTGCGADDFVEEVETEEEEEDEEEVNEEGHSFGR
ncbi:MAG: hypothetical protein Q9185_003123 [Variospora sp. 1 TL-2023]